MADTPTQPGPIDRVGAVDAANRAGDSADLAANVAAVHPIEVVLLRSSDGLDSTIGFGSCVRDGAALVCGIRPGETMVMGPPESVSGIVAREGGEGRPGTVDISHTRSVFAVSGPSATKVLEKVCSLDWSDAMMPDGACGSASVAKISCDVVRADSQGTARYLLVCGRSWGQYLYESLLDSAAEFSS